MSLTQLLLCMLAATTSTPASTDAEATQRLHLPLFRAPTKQEVEGSPHPILWSAHETEDSRRMLSEGRDIRLACLLNSVGSKFSAPLRSLVWKLVDEATGRETQHRLQGSNTDFSFELDGIKLKGRYSNWTGSTMDAAFPTLLKSQLRVRCEYQLQGLNESISSSWLLLWDERAELQRLRAATLQCNRTSYRQVSDVSRTQVAVTFSCTGLGDTRLLERAVVSAFASTSGCSPSAAAAGVAAMSSNSSTSGRNFFGFVFGGRLRFGWTIESGAWNGSSPSGAQLERRLEVPGSSLCLIVSCSLPSGQELLLNFSVSKVVTSVNSVVASPEEPLLADPEPTAVQLDELLDPPERVLPCPLLCLPGTTCRHRWLGPQATAPLRTPPPSQPQSLLLRSSDLTSSGLWKCSARPHGVSIAYAVTMKPRPSICGSRMPRQSVMFPTNRLSINCSLCGLAANTSVDFEVIESNGAPTYRMERTQERRSVGSVTLGLQFSDFQLGGRSATLILRCRASGKTHTAADVVTVYLLPTPVMKPLGVCVSVHSPCRADCRSPLMSSLQPLGVSVTYLFSVLSPSIGLFRVFLDTSGVLEDVRRAAGQMARRGLVRIECRQIFYYRDGREGLSVAEEFPVESQRALGQYRAELGEGRYNRLIFVLWDENLHVSILPDQKKRVDVPKNTALLYKMLAVFTCLILVGFVTVCICLGRPKVKKSSGDQGGDSSSAKPQDSKSSAIGDGGAEVPVQMDSVAPNKVETASSQSVGDSLGSLGQEQQRLQEQREREQNQLDRQDTQKFTQQHTEQPGPRYSTRQQLNHQKHETNHSSSATRFHLEANGDFMDPTTPMQFGAVTSFQGASSKDDSDHGQIIAGIDSSSTSSSDKAPEDAMLSSPDEESDAENQTPSPVNSSFARQQEPGSSENQTPSPVNSSFARQQKPGSSENQTPSPVNSSFARQQEPANAENQRSSSEPAQRPENRYRGSANKQISPHETQRHNSSGSTQGRRSEPRQRSKSRHGISRQTRRAEELHSSCGQEHRLDNKNNGSVVMQILKNRSGSGATTQRNNSLGASQELKNQSRNMSNSTKLRLDLQCNKLDSQQPLRNREHTEPQDRCSSDSLAASFGFDFWHDSDHESHDDQS